MTTHLVQKHEADPSCWDTCHIDIWFIIAKYLRPEDTRVFAQICKKTHSVTNSETFWKSVFNRYIRSKYPWLDIPASTKETCIRDDTIRELFKTYQPFSNRKLDPDSYDNGTNKICVSITHVFDDELQMRLYMFKLKSKLKPYGTLAKKNDDEGCQLLLVKAKQFVPVPYESDNHVIKSITKTLSRGFRAYKLTVKFCDQFSNNQAGEVLVFDPIVSVQLFDWWDQNYEKFLNNKS